MAKKGRNRKAGGKKAPEIERGFTVVDSNGKRVYLSSHPEGLPREEAEDLANGLAIEAKVVSVSEVH